MQVDTMPPEPPLEWTPEWGTREQYRAATWAWAEWWESHPHPFVPCAYCADCGKWQNCVHQRDWEGHQ